MVHRFQVWFCALVWLTAASCDKSEKKEDVAAAGVAPAAPEPAAKSEPPSPGMQQDDAEVPSADRPAPPGAPAEGANPATEEADPPKSAEAEGAQAPAPKPQGALPHPGHCDPVTPCPDGQGCSGLFFDAPGTCIPLAEAKAKCAKQNGEWGMWGARQRSYCMRLLSDGGKSCTDGGQCEGACIQEKGAKGAECQKYEIQYGCYFRLTDGDPGTMLCVD